MWKTCFSRGPLVAFKLASALVFTVLSWGQAPNRPDPVTVPAAERWHLTSSANSVTYQIDVALPQGYAGSQKRYPVLYTLDGNAYFTVLTDSYRLLQVDHGIPQELIIVGIGYPLRDYAWWSKAYFDDRDLDYTTKTKPGFRTLWWRRYIPRLSARGTHPVH